MADTLLGITDLGANAVVDFLLGANEGASNLRFIERPSRVVWAMDASAALQAEVEVFAGDRTVAQRGVVSGGGTAGVMPNLQQSARTFLAATSEILSFRVREIAGAATTDLNLYVSVEPL
ncbi:MAG: hypothetical protein V3S55_09920 [Nitrospiraceae bacterium]